MDLNRLLDGHQRLLMLADMAATSREKRAYGQFAREHAEQIRFTRHLLGAKPSLPGSVT